MSWILTDMIQIQMIELGCVVWGSGGVTIVL